MALVIIMRGLKRLQRNFRSESKQRCGGSGSRGGNFAALTMNISSFRLESEVGMFVNLSTRLVFLSSSPPPPFLHSPVRPLPSPSLCFKLDNENNEFGVCFFPALPHLACALLLTHSDPASYSLAHATNHYLSLFDSSFPPFYSIF